MLVHKVLIYENEDQGVRGDKGVILFVYMLRNESLVVHPSCHYSSTNSSCEPEASTSHGKIANEVPD